MLSIDLVKMLLVHLFSASMGQLKHLLLHSLIHPVRKLLAHVARDMTATTTGGSIRLFLRLAERVTGDAFVSIGKEDIEPRQINLQLLLEGKELSESVRQAGDGNKVDIKAWNNKLPILLTAHSSNFFEVSHKLPCLVKKISLGER